MTRPSAILESVVDTAMQIVRCARAVTGSRNCLGRYGPVDIGRILPCGGKTTDSRQWLRVTVSLDAKKSVRSPKREPSHFGSMSVMIRNIPCGIAGVHVLRV